MPGLTKQSRLLPGDIDNRLEGPEADTEAARRFRNPDAKKPGCNSRAFEVADASKLQTRRNYCADTGANLATRPSRGLKLCLARSVYIPAIFWDSATKVS